MLPARPGPTSRTSRAYTQLSAVEQSAAAKILRQAWPASTEADIQTYAGALSVESGDDADMAGDFEIDPTAHSTADAITYNEDASSLSNDSSRDETDFNKSQALAQKCLVDLGFSSGN
jgi:hypothetical protein